MLEYTTTLSIKECEDKFNSAINSFPKKQRERNKIDCFRGKAKRGKISIIFSRPLSYPYNKRHGNIALVGKLHADNNKTHLIAKFVSPVLIKSFYIPYFTVAILLLTLYSVSESIAVFALYKELAFFAAAYILLIFLSKGRSQSNRDKILKFIVTTMELKKSE